MKSLLRKFDEWFLGSIDYGLVHITAYDYMVWAMGQSFKKMADKFIYFGDISSNTQKEFDGLAKLLTPQLSQPLEDVEYDPIAN